MSGSAHVLNTCLSGGLSNIHFQVYFAAVELLDIFEWEIKHSLFFPVCPKHLDGSVMLYEWVVPPLSAKNAKEGGMNAK